MPLRPFRDCEASRRRLLQGVSAWEQTPVSIGSVQLVPMACERPTHLGLARFPCPPPPRTAPCGRASTLGPPRSQRCNHARRTPGPLCRDQVAPLPNLRRGSPPNTCLRPPAHPRYRCPWNGHHRRRPPPTVTLPHRSIASSAPGGGHRHAHARELRMVHLRLRTRVAGTPPPKEHLRMPRLGPPPYSAPASPRGRPARTRIPTPPPGSHGLAPVPKGVRHSGQTPRAGHAPLRFPISSLPCAFPSWNHETNRRVLFA